MHFGVLGGLGLAESILVGVVMFEFVVLYVLLRLEERRLGSPMLPGKSALLGATANLVAYGFLVGANLVIIPLVVEHSIWETFRIGVAVVVTSGLLLVAIRMLMPQLLSGMTTGAEHARKYLTGFNTFIAGITAFALLGGLIYFLLELMSQEMLRLEFVKEPLKMYVVVLATTSVFAAINLQMFLKSGDPAIGVIGRRTDATVSN